MNMRIELGDMREVRLGIMLLGRRGDGNRGRQCGTRKQCHFDQIPHGSASFKRKRKKTHQKTVFLDCMADCGGASLFS
ncbi:hypothetical protein [Novosphingobium resinovorum]|uniref:hypothetical protein n=1 Tax=Novosphingobium resinovorum TaxID=158500 RepID=UPI001F2B97BB|nr:hypothetical protein [Novosphingobium resinovorum]